VCECSCQSLDTASNLPPSNLLWSLPLSFTKQTVPIFATPPLMLLVCTSILNPKLPLSLSLSTFLRRLRNKLATALIVCVCTPILNFAFASIFVHRERNNLTAALIVCVCTPILNFRACNSLAHAIAQQIHYSPCCLCLHAHSKLPLSLSTFLRRLRNKSTTYKTRHVIYLNLWSPALEGLIMPRTYVPQNSCPWGWGACRETSSRVGQCRLSLRSRRQW